MVTVIHELERLRRDTCGQVFTAAAPADLPTEKYDPNVGVMVGSLRYGCGASPRRKIVVGLASIAGP